MRPHEIMLAKPRRRYFCLATMSAGYCGLSQIHSAPIVASAPGFADCAEGLQRRSLRCHDHRSYWSLRCKPPLRACLADDLPLMAFVNELRVQIGIATVGNLERAEGMPVTRAHLGRAIQRSDYEGARRPSDEFLNDG